MNLEQQRWSQDGGWVPGTAMLSRDAQLVLVFGSTAVLADSARIKELKTMYPTARMLGCSTAGEICGTRVFDDSLVATAIRFECTNVKGAEISIEEGESSAHCGERLARALDPKGLVHALVLSDGIKINGSELVRGILKHLPRGTAVTGGLSGDGARFKKTLVFADAEPREGRIAILGLYFSRLRVGYWSLGGWDPFGP